MSNMNKERQLIKEAYPDSKGWQARVDRMSDEQVFVIYIRLKNKGLIKV